jgi:hypothetical protein
MIGFDQDPAREIFAREQAYSMPLVEQLLLLRPDGRPEVPAMVIKPEPFKALQPHHELRF